jgi:N-acetyl-anhydromuramyl-L-alanine amidase AmpD
MSADAMTIAAVSHRPPARRLPEPAATRRPVGAWPLGFFCAALLLACGCNTFPRAGRPEPRQGDEIVAAGQFFHTGTRVVLWLDPGGYDAYRVERRFAPLAQSGWEASQAEVETLTTPNRYGLRRAGLTPAELERVRGGGWDLPLLQRVVDQFVLHFDVAGTSRTCFRVLQDDRDLSVHFMLDLDGTIYQTLDLKERAFHATIANDRSVGVEIANIGAYPAAGNNPFAEWYRTNAGGRVDILVPEQLNGGGIRTANFIGHPARNEPVRGVIQGKDLVQYDFTPEQYAALAKLTASLCRIFPKLKCQYPADANGKVIPHKLANSELRKYEGVLGHYHIQTDKVDPGPALDWDRVIGGARRILGIAPLHAAASAGPLLTPRARDLLR